MARSRTPTERLLGPVKTALQLAPPSVLLKAPAVPVPAYTVEGALGSMARAPTTGACNPVSTMLQLSPPSVLLKTPPPVHDAGREGLVGPARRAVGDRGSVTRARTKRLVSPVLTAPQVTPPSVLLKAPLLYVPAYRVAGAWGSIARAEMKITPGLVSPLAWQPPPPSVRLNTASVAAAMRI